MLLEKENEKLKESLRMEQEARLEQTKDLMELETRLKTGEDEVIKSQEERYQLSMDIGTISKNQTELFSKIKESEEFLDICVAFLQKNGLLASSFLSDDIF
jgi:septal ring factor EnvC (AmiA/AmiB activator)